MTTLEECIAKELEKSRSAYDKGFVDALTAFAWWKDGKQYVGSCGTTLQDAIENRFKNPYFQSPK